MKQIGGQIQAVPKMTSPHQQLPLFWMSPIDIDEVEGEPIHLLSLDRGIEKDLFMIMRPISPILCR